MKNNLIKYVKIISIILLVSLIGIYAILSQDTYHEDNCCIEHCAMCNIIHIAQSVVKQILSAFIVIAYIMITLYLYYKIYKIITIQIHKTLIEFNIQLNE